MRNQWRVATGVILATVMLGACNGENPAGLADATGGAGGALFASQEVCTTVDFSG
ncbi:MAG: hypothetical protein HKP01_02940, partial [Gemmatimonadetes bacterium]|nr:hypothetical protein [Gemmatimonadota bacterium]